MAEGYKRNRNVVSICNSDPEMVALAQCWMARLTSKDLSYAIQYHADQDLDRLRATWGEKLAIEPASIALQRKSNSNHLTGRTWRSRYGVLTVTARDTLLRSRLEAWMDCLRRTWAVDFDASGRSSAW